MTDKKDFSTYAITLYFDDATTDWIRGLMTQLADVTGNDFVTANSVPPHLTLGMFHANDADVGNLKTQFENFVSTVRAGNFSFDISFSGFESFLDKVIFIKPVVDENLSELNKLLHEKFLPHFEPADNRNYLPENWYPHIALGVKLSHEQFEKGMEFLGKDEGLLSGRCACITTIGLACCNPYTPMIDELIG